MKITKPNYKRDARTRTMLREVDLQLLRFGPRRARQCLERVRTETPRGMMSGYERYKRFLADMIERLDTRRTDPELLEYGKVAAASHHAVEAGDRQEVAVSN